MRYRPILTLLFFSLLSFGAMSQNVLDLQQCIDRALQQSLDIRSSQLSIEGQSVNLVTNKAARYPNLNGQVSYGSNWGRTIDPTINLFRTRQLDVNSWGFGSSMTVFNAGKINNNIRSAEFSKMAAEKDYDQARDDVSLAVVQAYLSILAAEDNLKNVDGRVAIATKQLDRTLAMIEAGSLNAAARYELESQLALEEESKVQAENSLEIARLDMLNLLMLDPDYDFVLDRPDLDRIMVNEAGILNQPFDAIYATALENQHSIAAQNFREEAALRNEKASRADFYPSLSLGGNMNTNWSSAEDPLTGEKVDYLDQLDQNLGYGYNLSLSIPIYNNNQIKNSVAFAKIDSEREKVNGDRLRQQLRNDILRARADAIGARKSFDAAGKTYEASKISFENAQRRLDLGHGNNFDYQLANDNLRIAENNLLQAQYQFIFKLKVLDYYLGNPIKL